MKNIKIFIPFFVAIGLLFMACDPKVDSGIGLGPVPTDAQIDFSIEPGADSYHWILKNNSSVNGITYWDLGNGATASGNEVEVHYPDIDTYTITLTLVTSGGSVTKTIEHVQEVADPLFGNLVKGGKFETADDIANWTIQYPDLGNPGIVEFVNGRVHYDNAPWSWGQATIYQPIEVSADQEYRVDLNFETAGVFNAWFKVYACLTEPVDGTEYTGPILITEIPIWGADIPAKSGRLLDLYNPDSGNQNNCVVTFPTSGTIWLEIQCGAQELFDGVYIDNVEFRAYFGDK